MITVLISVYDKTGLLDLLKKVKDVSELKLIATTSTAKYLQDNGFVCQKVRGPYWFSRNFRWTG